ncbi:hypothetical protein RAB80_010121 [Fusarium oxysporum f. sp. vasinfectum]|nr:hypothetical protein RAB80_010121 [Fusarium oxysporum f. sp. vasinfectum]
MTANAEPSTQVAPNIIPEYEVKLLLKPTAVLRLDKELQDTVLSTFDMPPSITKQSIQFLDTDSKDIYAAGWSTRIRKTENDDGLELTYKKRYAIMGGDIDAALTTANNDGFDAGDVKYEAQVEWGYQKQTLSISRKKIVESTNSKLDNLRGNNWGTGMLAKSRIFGPVHAKRSVGKWEGMQLYIEVWPIGKRGSTEIDYLVEASFKTESRITASAKHNSFISFLQDKGWFLCKDSLKTQLIMDRY